MHQLNKSFIQSSQIFHVVNDNEVDQICTQINLDKNITGRETVANLPDHPKLKAFSDHCTRQRTCFFSIKKREKVYSTTCLPPGLPSDVFDRLYHLPDPTPDPTNETIKNLLAILLALKQPKLLCRHVILQRTKGVEYHLIP